MPAARSAPASTVSTLPATFCPSLNLRNAFADPVSDACSKGTSALQTFQWGGYSTGSTASGGLHRQARHPRQHNRAGPSHIAAQPFTLASAGSQAADAGIAAVRRQALTPGPGSEPCIGPLACDAGFDSPGRPACGPHLMLEVTAINSQYSSTRSTVAESGMPGRMSAWVCYGKAGKGRVKPS